MLRPERVATHPRPNRLQIALAAAWIILSFAVGGIVQADAGTDAAPRSAAADGTVP